MITNTRLDEIEATWKHSRAVHRKTILDLVKEVRQLRESSNHQHAREPYLRYQVVYRVPQPGGDGAPLEVLDSVGFDTEEEAHAEVARRADTGWDCYAISYTILPRSAQALTRS